MYRTNVLFKLIWEFLLNHYLAPKKCLTYYSESSTSWLYLYVSVAKIQINILQAEIALAG